MGRFSVGFQKTSGAAAGFLVQLRTPSTADLRLVEVGIFASTAVASQVGLVRATAVGSGFTSITPPQEDPTTAATSIQLDTAATTAPTVGTVPLRRISLPATIGSGVIWSWPSDRGIFVGVSSGLLLYQYSTAAVTYDGYLTFEG